MLNSTNTEKRISMDNWIICFAEESDKKYYNMEMLYKLGINTVLCYLQDMYFQLNPEKVIDWNTFIDDEWSKLDGVDYYADCPTIDDEEMEFFNEWLIYEEGGIFCLDEYIEILENRLYSIKKMKNTLNNL